MEPTTHPEAQEHHHTWEDFLALEEDDLRELVDGDLVEIEVPTARHEYIVGLIVILVGSWARTTKSGVVFASGYKVRVNRKRGFMPDVQFFRRGNVPTPAQNQGLENGRPDLAIEVISPSSRRFDRVMKLNSYAQIGVPEYWLIDSDAQSLERLVLKDGRYTTVDAVADDAVLRPDTFPGLEISLAELWAPMDDVRDDG